MTQVEPAPASLIEELKRRRVFRALVGYGGVAFALLQIAKDPEGGAYQIAEVYSWRGEKDRAFEWLQRAYVQRDAGLGYLKIDFLLRSLCGDPRWNKLLQSVHLPPDP